MKRHNPSLCALALAGMFGSGLAAATPIGLPGNSPLFIQYTNAEQVNTANGIGNTNTSSTAAWSEGNWGLLSVSTAKVGVPKLSPPHSDILSGTNPVFFTDITDGQITGIFYGVQLGTDPTKGTGGKIDLYWHDKGVKDCTALDGVTADYCSPGVEINKGIGAIAANRTAQDTYKGFTNGTFLVEFLLTAKPGPLDPAGTTISSTTDPTSAAGQANSYIDVNSGKPGAWTNLFTAWFQNWDNGTTFASQGIPNHDGRTRSIYSFADGWNNKTTVGLSSSDPVRLFTVPEPASLALFGVALVGLGLSRRRVRNGPQATA